MSVPHSNRNELAGEHRYTDTGQLVLFAVFLIVWITDSFLIPHSVFLAVHVPVSIRLAIGILTLIASVLLVLSAHRAVFGKLCRKPGVISKGAFSLVRHPMYFGSWLFSAGLVSITFSLSSAAVSIMIFIFYYLVARHEELLLLKKFGAAYRRYQDRVPMFVPLTRGGSRRSKTDNLVDNREYSHYHTGCMDAPSAPNPDPISQLAEGGNDQLPVRARLRRTDWGAEGALPPACQHGQGSPRVGDKSAGVWPVSGDRPGLRQGRFRRLAWRRGRPWK